MLLLACWSRKVYQKIKQTKFSILWRHNFCSVCQDMSSMTKRHTGFAEWWRFVVMSCHYEQMWHKVLKYSIQKFHYCFGIPIIFCVFWFSHFSQLLYCFIKFHCLSNSGQIKTLPLKLLTHMLFNNFNASTSSVFEPIRFIDIICMILLQGYSHVRGKWMFYVLCCTRIEEAMDVFITSTFKLFFLRKTSSMRWSGMISP